MTLTMLRALLMAHGYKTAAAIDRFDVKREHGVIVGVDAVLTDGTLAYLLVDR
jgi:hypothetical protein